MAALAHEIRREQRDLHLEVTYVSALESAHVSLAKQIAHDEAAGGRYLDEREAVAADVVVLAAQRAHERAEEAARALAQRLDQRWVQVETQACRRRARHGLADRGRADFVGDGRLDVGGQKHRLSERASPRVRRGVGGRVCAGVERHELEPTASLTRDQHLERQPAREQGHHRSPGTHVICRPPLLHENRESGCTAGPVLREEHRS